MADISIINKDNTNYNVKDAVGREALAVVENKGAKNILKLGFTHKSAGTQTADMTADGNGIIVNGDRNATTDTILVYDLVTNKSNMLDTRYTLPAGKYVIPSTGTSNLRYQVYCHDGTNYQSLGYTTSDPLEFEYTPALKTQYPYIAYRLWASKVSSFDNYTTYPMICTKEEWDISQAYVPYRPSWQEMYESKADKPEFVSSISSAIDSQTDGTICGYVGSASTIPNVSAEYIVARTYTTDNSLDRRIQIVESAGGARETRYYNGTSWGSWTPA